MLFCANWWIQRFDVFFGDFTPEILGLKKNFIAFFTEFIFLYKKAFDSIETGRLLAETMVRWWEMYTQKLIGIIQ